ncbi:MAG: CDP-alcohol phosphatidyltransferase family protein [Vicinamibacterales bacterium]
MRTAEPVATGLAFKAREIEELVDIYFFRRLGIVFAHAARALGLSPTTVTFGALFAGAIGGAMLAWPGWAPIGVVFLFLHGVLDSSDGQLARMTGRSTEFGRVMDGVAGYVTHVAMYLGILASASARGWGWELVGLAAAAGFSTIVHAQMYDYHRTTYATFAIKGSIPPAVAGTPHTGLLGFYEGMQRALAGLHPVVERRLAGRALAGQVRDEDRQLYRTCFYRPVRGWNLMGDNLRRLSIALAVWAGRPEWFVFAELIPVNLACGALWLLQQRADRRFLAATAR